MLLESSTLQTRRWPRVRPHYGGAPRSGPHTLRSYTPYQREGQSSTSSPRPSAAICNSMANRPSHCVELTQRRSIALCCRHRYGRVGRDGMADEALEEPAWQMVGVAYATRWRRLVLYCHRVRSWQRIWGIIGQRLQEVKKPLRDRLRQLWPAPSQRSY